jgi:hypothetical protein
MSYDTNKLADAVEKLNAGVDSLGKRMDAMRADAASVPKGYKISEVGSDRGGGGKAYKVASPTGWLNGGQAYSSREEAESAALAHAKKLGRVDSDKPVMKPTRKDASNEEHFREAALQQARAYEKQGRHEQAKKSREEAAKWAEKAKNPAPVSRLSDLGPFKK